jgi:uncharacterized protein (TIGR02001 family)
MFEEIEMNFKKKLVPLSIAVALSVPGLTVSSAAQAEWTGNIGVHSKYLLRGIFEENDGAAVQGGLDYSNASGFYAGWWASSLGYTYDASGTDPYTSTGFENDFYAGFSGEFGDIGWDVGLLQYYYISVDDSDLTELTANVSYGPFTAGIQYLLNDGAWGNSGDIYWKLGYSTDLPKGFSFAADLGYYTYDDSDNSELLGSTLDDSGFRHLNLTLSHPIANTGADMYVQYTVAGDDREGTEYDDTMVLGITYGFDVK